jgi:Ni,Fe-hydrogenase maturation factor
MGADLPQEVHVVAVEAERVYDFSDELSPAVAAAIPRATAEILRVLSTADNEKQRQDMAQEET